MASTVIFKALAVLTFLGRAMFYNCCNQTDVALKETFIGYIKIFSRKHRPVILCSLAKIHGHFADSKVEDDIYFAFILFLSLALFFSFSSSNNSMSGIPSMAGHYRLTAAEVAAMPRDLPNNPVNSTRVQRETMHISPQQEFYAVFEAPSRVPYSGPQNSLRRLLSTSDKSLFVNINEGRDPKKSA